MCFYYIYCAGLRPRQGLDDAYVFPDAELLPLHTVCAAAEASGFELHDLENLREHYALTLRHWAQELESIRSRAVGCWMRLLIEAGCLHVASRAHEFSSGKLSVYQALLVKADGKSAGPLTRADWYAEAEVVKREVQDFKPRKWRCELLEWVSGSGAVWINFFVIPNKSQSDTEESCSP